MMQVCRPTPLVRFMLMSETWLKATHVSHTISNNTGAFYPLHWVVELGETRLSLKSAK
jgi:hypothetical protein